MIYIQLKESLSAALFLFDTLKRFGDRAVLTTKSKISMSKDFVMSPPSPSVVRYTPAKMFFKDVLIYETHKYMIEFDHNKETGVLIYVN